MIFCIDLEKCKQGFTMSSVLLGIPNVASLHFQLARAYTSPSPKHLIYRLVFVWIRASSLLKISQLCAILMTWISIKIFLDSIKLFKDQSKCIKLFIKKSFFLFIILKMIEHCQIKCLIYNQKFKVDEHRVFMNVSEDESKLLYARVSEGPLKQCFKHRVLKSWSLRVSTTTQHIYALHHHNCI